MARYFVILVTLSIAKYIHCQFDCSTNTYYSGRLFPKPEDIFHGQHLKGFSYQNITADDPRKCYSSCVQDCRCKACQMKDARCELLDEDKTSEADKFVNESGYVYYDLKQTIIHGKSHMSSHGEDCSNGCCRSHPCMNGGTCIEHCESPKKKFTCRCTNGYHGRLCNIAFNSCTDVMKFSKIFPKDGVYKITRTDNNSVIPLYCAFVRPNQAWTLIESFSLAKNGLLIKKPFSLEASQNPSSPPNWELFRMSFTGMSYARSKSTLFRATCDFPKRNGSLTPDFLLGILSDVDIIEKTLSFCYSCTKYKLINIKGHNCTDCTIDTLHNNVFHLHVTSSNIRYTCNLCKSDLITGQKHYFGLYWNRKIDSNFTCTKTKNSTTQWWLGDEI